jgi:hypothetical protein
MLVLDLVAVDFIFQELFVLDALLTLTDAQQLINAIIIALDFTYSKEPVMPIALQELSPIMPLSNAHLVIVLEEPV